MHDRISFTPDCAPVRGAAMYKALELVMGDNIQPPYYLSADVVGDLFILVAIEEHHYAGLCQSIETQANINVDDLGGVQSVYRMLPDLLHGSGFIEAPKDGMTITYQSNLYEHELYISVSQMKDMKSYEMISPLQFN